MSCSLLDKWLTHYDPLHRGFTADGIANGVTATAGWFFPRIRGGYNVRRAVGRKPTADDPIVGAAGADAATVANFTWRGHAPSTVYHYRLNAIGPGGIEELGERSVVRAAFDAAGDLIPSRPNVPTNLRVEREAGGTFRLRWTYSEADEEVSPAAFEVYADNGAGTVDYETAVAIVPFVARRFHYERASGAFAHGTKVKWSVRAVSAAGVNDANTIVVAAVAVAEGPPVHQAIVSECGTETR